MKLEKSCGAVVFTKDSGNIQYVIIRSREGVCGFPKGHMEGTESEPETALREIREETGLNVTLIDGFRREISYRFTWKGKTIEKNVVYFLAEYSHQTPIPQEAELQGIDLMTFDRAIAALPFENAKQKKGFIFIVFVNFSRGFLFSAVNPPFYSFYKG